MSVPFLDLGRLHDSIRSELDQAVRRVVDASSFIGGGEVQAFEAAFGEAHGLPAGAGCGCGTDALGLALRALGIGPGDEVVVPSMTFVATAEAVVHVGATPVIADVDPESLLLTPETVAAVMTDQVRAVIPVHLYGHLVPFDAIRGWRNAGLVVVEDSAQAHLGEWQGMPVGTVGDAACFSFFPGKNLGAFGDGGMVLSTSDTVIADVRAYRDHGRTSKYLHDRVGDCSRLDGLQAAVLGTKLMHLASWTDRRRAVAERYRSLLPSGVLVPWEEGAVHHLLVTRVSNREAVQARLKSAGVATGIHYPVALSEQPWIAALGPKPTPVAEQAAREVLSLPIDPLMTDDEVDEVVSAFTAALDTGG